MIVYVPLMTDKELDWVAAKKRMVTWRMSDGTHKEFGLLKDIQKVEGGYMLTVDCILFRMSVEETASIVTEVIVQLSDVKEALRPRGVKPEEGEA